MVPRRFAQKILKNAISSKITFSHSQECENVVGRNIKNDNAP